MEELDNHFLLWVDESRAAGDDLPVFRGVNAEHKLAASHLLFSKGATVFARSPSSSRPAHLDMQCGVSPCAESRKAFRRVDEKRWFLLFVPAAAAVTMTISSFTKMSRY